MEPVNPSLARFLRDTLEARADELARTWLARLGTTARAGEPARYPTQILLEYMPKLIRVLPAGLQGKDPMEEPGVREEVLALSKLRRRQGFPLSTLLHEFDVLGEVVGAAVEEACEHFEATVPLSEAFRAARRLQRSVDAMSQLTVELYNREITSSQLERSMLLDEFSRAVSHELRNRLNAVSLAADLFENRMREVAGDSGVDEDFAAIRSRLKRLDGVVEDVFAISVVHGRGASFDAPVQDFDRLVAAVVEDFANYATLRGVDIRVVGDLPSFPVDATRLQLVLVNLLSNAIKYSNPAETERWVEISAEGDGPRHIVRVRDNGIGIAPEDQARIFDRHTRGQQLNDQKGEGIGLHLALSAARQTGGELWLVDDVEDCTEFAFDLQRSAEVRRGDDDA